MYVVPIPEDKKGEFFGVAICNPLFVILNLTCLFFSEYYY